MKTDLAPPLRSLFGAVCALWTTGLALLAVPSAAQLCGEAGCRMQVTATSSQPSYRAEDLLVYTLTVQNTGQLNLPFVNLYVLPDGATNPDDPACGIENRGWGSPDRPPGPPLRGRDAGPLRPGEKKTLSFCVRVLGSIDPCYPVTLLFEAYLPNRFLVFKTSVRTPPASCTSPCRSDAGAEGGAACCVAGALHCLFNPTDSLCGGSISAAAGAALGRLASGAVAAGASFFGTVADLGLLYLLRDNVLATTPGGRGAIALYETHQAELKRLLLADPALRERAVDVLTAWRPVIDGLMGPPDAATTISAAQVAELESFLGELRVVAGPGLRAAIDRESQALDLDAVAGLRAGQGLQRLNKLTCIPGPTTLCLSGGRIRVETEWETGAAQRGSGRAVALTGDTGTFWFFNAANVETIVKVVDACSLNDRRWVFTAGLTNVGVVTTVTDTATGAVRTYTNPLDRRFAPVQDTNAFDCTP